MILQLLYDYDRFPPPLKNSILFCVCVCSTVPSGFAIFLLSDAIDGDRSPLVLAWRVKRKFKTEHLFGHNISFVCYVDSNKFCFSYLIRSSFDGGVVDFGCSSTYTSAYAERALLHIIHRDNDWTIPKRKLVTVVIMNTINGQLLVRQQHMLCICIRRWIKNGLSLTFFDSGGFDFSMNFRVFSMENYVRIYIYTYMYACYKIKYTNKTDCTQVHYMCFLNYAMKMFRFSLYITYGEYENEI